MGIGGGPICRVARSRVRSGLGQASFPPSFIRVLPGQSDDPVAYGAVPLSTGGALRRVEHARLFEGVHWREPNLCCAEWHFHADDEMCVGIGGLGGARGALAGKACAAWASPIGGRGDADGLGLREIAGSKGGRADPRGTYALIG
jgi:hypothetical protein